ncbi:hypothetical protein OIN60_14660 [Paenibacillus sp. P96]|uniref:YqkK n=1 Tax=Paenibacillus zeirhizosphaerae TaxID=2987519 RepID=A0ABT9FTC8_9BACL|nr:hypothetical protein [Paenibacillus sp. P96]MDP4097998.1 hypothetical protein [Paenibacillus sp. P96]
MARTKTQKAITKAERAGKRSFADNRRTNEQYGALSQHERTTPTKLEKLHKIKHKKRIGDDGAFFIFGEKQGA